MIKKIVFSICAIVAVSSTISAQRVPTLSINVAGNKTTVSAGGQVVMKVKGYNDETSNLQWQTSKDGRAWKNIAKATGDIFETEALAETNYFRVVTRANEGYLTVEEISNTQMIALGEETATVKKKRN